MTSLREAKNLTQIKSIKTTAVTLIFKTFLEQRTLKLICIKVVDRCSFP